jgi:hypothetical protein
MNRQVPDFMDNGPFSSLRYHESHQDQIILFHSELDIFNPESDKSSHSSLKNSPENKFIVRLGVPGWNIDCHADIEDVDTTDEITCGGL